MNAYFIKNNIEAWDTIPNVPTKLLALAEARKTASAPSAASGHGVDATLLREALGYLDPDTGYEQWRDRVAAIGAANCSEAREIAHEWSRGKLDRHGRYADGCPSYDADAVDRVLDTMPPKEGGVGVGSIEHDAHEAGWSKTLAPRPMVQDLMSKDALSKLLADSVADADARPAASTPGLLPSFMGGEIGQITPPRWLVKGLLPTPAVGIIFGKFGTFKTTTKLDIADSILTATKAFGHFDADRGDVVLVAGEGLSGLKTRVEARAQSHGLTLAQYPVLLVTKVPKADRPEEWVALAETIKARGLKPKFIGIDHLSIMLSGQDQNDAAVATQAMQMAHELSSLFQCTVIILAHAGKEGDREVRGSSAFLDNVDFAYELTRADGGDIVRVRCAKMRDGEAPEPFFLKAQSRHGAAIMTYADKDDARRAEGKQVGLRVQEVSAALVALGACPDGANCWDGKAGGIPTKTLATQIATARHAAEEDGLAPSFGEIKTLVMALNREGRAGGHFDVLVVSEGAQGRQWAIAPGSISGKAAHV